jgi:DNA repair protein RecN (Recombination protein N)
MSLLLGERASTEVVRKGSSKAVVEGIFYVEGNKKVKKILDENEIDFQPELIMRREISIIGSNRCFINDSPVQLSLIKEIGNLLVDLHGQHEHQSLLRIETHIDFLDEFANLEELRLEYQLSYGELQKKIKHFNQLKEKESSLKEKRDIYYFQIKEIDSVAPQENEEENLNNELNILENSERILELSDEIYSSLYDSENSVNDILERIKIELEELIKIDRTLQEAGEEFNSAITLLNDVSKLIRDYKSKIDIDPEHLDKIRTRLGALNLLKKKYGGSIKAVIEHREKIGRDYELAENYSGSISAIEQEIKALREKCGAIAEKLSKKRNEAAIKIQKEVKEALAYLGIPDSIFQTRIIQTQEKNGNDNYILAGGKAYKSFPTGYDEVEFYISTNLGEDTKPLSKVASGGEISRIMLALKTILAQNDKLPLLIFDEIDTGVSGRVAQKVGQSLKSLANFHQIIAITHLPQIASLAAHHFAVEKKQNAGRVVSSIRKLKDEERIEEIAKLMSGEKITEASINGAKELMGL